MQSVDFNGPKRFYVGQGLFQGLPGATSGTYVPAMTPVIDESRLYQWMNPWISVTCTDDYYPAPIGHVLFLNYMAHGGSAVRIWPSGGGGGGGDDGGGGGGEYDCEWMTDESGNVIWMDCTPSET